VRELSLFSGAGGGLLATKHLLGWETVGYVEIDEYCQAVLAQRIKDGYLDSAPIFGDITQFIEEGYAEAYQGMVDVITAGFPCQPFSVAGKGLAEADERNQWPNTIECIRLVRPRFVFLENVPGLLTHEYIRHIYGTLAEVGYDSRWDCISAAHCGANHKRLRWWLVAHSVDNEHSGGRGQDRETNSVQKNSGSEVCSG
jgi:DNA (cytosine-5)-methyltransferase 1